MDIFISILCTIGTVAVILLLWWLSNKYEDFSLYLFISLFVIIVLASIYLMRHSILFS